MTSSSNQCSTCSLTDRVCVLRMEATQGLQAWFPLMQLIHTVLCDAQHCQQRRPVWTHQYGTVSERRSASCWATPLHNSLHYRRWNLSSTKFVLFICVPPAYKISSGTTIKGSHRRPNRNVVYTLSTALDQLPILCQTTCQWTRGHDHGTTVQQVPASPSQFNKVAD